MRTRRPSDVAERAGAGDFATRNGASELCRLDFDYGDRLVRAVELAARADRTMPHLTIEYTGNLSPKQPFDSLFARLHAVLADLGGIRKSNCKSRAVKIDRFFVGEGGADAAFVHADVRFLEGRSVSTKQDIGRAILTVLREDFPAPPGIRDLQITVEIQDIERATYFKHPEGSLDYRNP